MIYFTLFVANDDTYSPFNTYLTSLLPFLPSYTSTSGVVGLCFLLELFLWAFGCSLLAVFKVALDIGELTAGLLRITTPLPLQSLFARTSLSAGMLCSFMLRRTLANMTVVSLSRWVQSRGHTLLRSSR